jgi:hypothetical protein
MEKEEGRSQYFLGFSVALLFFSFTCGESLNVPFNPSGPCLPGKVGVETQGPQGQGAWSLPSLEPLGGAPGGWGSSVAAELTPPSTDGAFCRPPVTPSPWSPLSVRCLEGGMCLGLLVPGSQSLKVLSPL